MLKNRISEGSQCVGEVTAEWPARGRADSGDRLKSHLKQLKIFNRR